VTCSVVAHSLRNLVLYIACLAQSACGSESAEERALRLQEAKEAAREASAITQACITMDTHWSLDPSYATEGGVDRCVESIEPRAAKLGAGSSAKGVARAEQIRELLAAACEVDHGSEQCPK